MSMSKNSDTTSKASSQTPSQKRRNRRKKLKKSHTDSVETPENKILDNIEIVREELSLHLLSGNALRTIDKANLLTMTKEIPTQSREEVKAAREAKKLAKQKAKNKGDESGEAKQPITTSQVEIKPTNVPKEPIRQESNDEVDRATAPIESVEQGLPKDKDHIKAERAAKKAAKQAKKKGATPSDITPSLATGTPQVDTVIPKADTVTPKADTVTPKADTVTPKADTVTPKADTDMTVRDVVETLRDIKNIAQQVKEVSVKVQALDLNKKDSEKTEEGGKSKAELKAERRAKQEAQRAAKEAAAQAKASAAKAKEEATKPKEPSSKTVVVKEKSPKPKTPGRQILKQQSQKANWFRHLYKEDYKTKLDKLPINSNLHPAIIKLGVQLATRVVTGSNARCVALLDALKKMVRDYSLPAKTEFGRGLEAHLAASLQFLWAMRQPTASQTNAVKFFRHHLTQLPNNVDEFDAKKTLQEEIDRYIREQIEMAGEAISIAIRKKICNGDNIFTYGCSSLIERIFVEAHSAGVQFRAVACGGAAAREMVRRLTAKGVACMWVDITALNFIMRTVDKVVLGASCLLANGSVVGAAGTGAAALAARACNIPVLVAAETHKFCERVHTDAFVYNEIGDPDDLIDKSDENSPLKDWRSNPNLTPLNLTYDITPPNLVTAVVTELAILPCTSAPVVLRFKLSEYSI